MTDQAHDQAIAYADALLTARPDLKPTLEALYAKAWPETLTLLAALASAADHAHRQEKQPHGGVPASQNWPPAGELTAPSSEPKSGADNTSANPPSSAQLRVQGPGNCRAPAGGLGAEPPHASPFALKAVI